MANKPVHRETAQTSCVGGNATASSCTGIDYRKALEAIGRGAEGRLALLFASNRGPVELIVNKRGEVEVHRGMGGLVTALTSAIETVDATWVASALTEFDVAAARLSGGRVEIPLGARRLAISLVTPDREDYRRYYDVVANRVLWFLLHGIADTPHEPDFDPDMWQSWAAYRRINMAFAARLAAQADPPHHNGNGHRAHPIFLVQDYHLFLVPGFLRRRVPGATIQHFTHVCWPGPDALRQVPRQVRTEILESLLACDVIGFHTSRYVRNFCLAVREFLEADVDHETGTIRHKGRLVRVRSYPISIDPEGISAFSASPEVRRHQRLLAKHAPPGTNVILQVARSDPSKNVLRSLKAYDLYLERNPAARGKSLFMAILPASRQGAEPYRRYLNLIRDQAKRLEAVWGTETWRPLVLITEDDYARGIAAMARYDVLLVNSLADGMNLVAKEGPVVNRRNGVLILSENAGAAEELAEGAILIHPYDIRGTAEAIEKALTMAAPTRRKMAATLRDQVRQHSVFRWLHDQLRDLIPQPVAEVRKGRLVVSPFWNQEEAQ